MFECELSRGGSVGGQVDAGSSSRQNITWGGVRWQRIVDVEMEGGALMRVVCSACVLRRIDCDGGIVDSGKSILRQESCSVV